MTLHFAGSCVRFLAGNFLEFTLVPWQLVPA